MPADYFGALGADVEGLENIFDAANGRRATVAANNATGSGTATLGTNCPAVTLTPNTWEKVTLADGSTGFLPLWK